MNELISELNKIIAEEMKPNWYWMCMFCGEHSGNGNWMAEHIQKHCNEHNHLLMEGEWEDHTITVEPTIDGLRAGYYYLGFRQ